AAELLDKYGTLRARADQAHVTAQDVDELRQLVETGAAEKCSQARAPRIVLPRPYGPRLLLGIYAHAAKLEHLEGAAVKPAALLAIEDRLGTRELDQRCDYQHQRR